MINDITPCQTLSDPSFFFFLANKEKSQRESPGVSSLNLIALFYFDYI